MRIVEKRAGAIIVCLALAACGAPPPRPSAPPGEPPAAAVPARAAPARGSRYHIDPARSELRVLVYRAGPMASLGHNHVISTHSLQGWATYDGRASAAAFALTIPVVDFVIDDPRLRGEEGADFAEPVADEAKAGTQHNMLGPAVLNAADFPALSIRSVEVTEASGSFQARLALEVAGHASTLLVPFTLDEAPGTLVAHGEITVSQSSIGMTPLSVFLGALKVQDDLRVKFAFTAVADGA